MPLGTGTPAATLRGYSARITLSSDDAPHFGSNHGDEDEGSPWRVALFAEIK
jgi:hypothetical protein